MAVRIRRPYCSMLRNIAGGGVSSTIHHAALATMRRDRTVARGRQRLTKRGRRVLRLCQARGLA